MPLYDYECQKCGSVFEVRQKFADVPLEVHEGCGGHVHRLLSAPALQFKGTGWYVTDYGRGGNSSAGSNGKPDGKSDTKSDTKTETKPASKTETKPAPAASDK